MKTLKTWPHLTLIAVGIAVLVGSATAFLIKNRRDNQQVAVLSAARIERVEGEVGINNSSTDPSNAEWIAATENAPISTGDRIYTRDNSRASIAFSGRNFVRLDDGSAFDVLTLSQDRTQVALRDGTALFDVGHLGSGQLFEVATPYGAVDFNQPGLYEVGIDDNGGAWVSVLSGLAQVVGLAGSGQINKGEMLRLVGQTAAEVALSRIDPGYAGALVNDYYGYRYPDYYDGRYNDYNAYVADPYYYDPTRRYTSYRYVDNRIPGLYDLDAYGDWQSIDNYGYAWRPRVDGSWAPYQSGYWTNDYPYGLTWVSSEPWGYAPYHYGRWANVNGQWYWVPESYQSYPTYAPALVAFLPQSNEIGWVPLAPGEVYTPRYYDPNWQPHYWGDVSRLQHVQNMGFPGAVTFVPWQYFDQEIYRDRIHHYERERLATIRPELEPLADGPLRNAILRSAWGRGKKLEIPPGIAKRLDDQNVIVGNALPGDANSRFGRRVKYQEAPVRARREKLKVKDERSAQADAGFVRSEPARGERVGNSGKAEREALKNVQRQQRDFGRAQKVDAQPKARARGQEGAVKLRGRGNEQQFRVNPKPEPQKRVEFKGPPVRHSANDSNLRQKGRGSVEMTRPNQTQPRGQGQQQRVEHPQVQRHSTQPAAPQAHGREQKAQGGGKAKGKGRG